MPNLIELDVETRNGVEFSPARSYVFDIDDLESVIREDSFGKCYFKTKEIKGLYNDVGNYAKVDYVVSQSIAAIEPLSSQLFALTVLQRRDNVTSFPESMIFYSKKFMGYIRVVADGDFAGKTEFYYAEDGDPDGVYYIVDEPLSYFITSVSPVANPIFVENTLFVDSVYGNNATAAPERLDRPYATIAAAIAAASSGQTVWVWAGDHNVNTNIFKDQVKLHLNPNTVVNITGAGSVSSTGAGHVFQITGDGNIVGGGALFFEITHSLASIQVDCNIFRYNGIGAAVSNQNGFFKLKSKFSEFYNGTVSFYSFGDGYMDIESDNVLFASSLYIAKPITCENTVASGTLFYNKFKFKHILSVDHDFGIFNFRTEVNFDNSFEADTIEYRSNNTASTIYLGACSLNGKVTLKKGSWLTTAGGLYLGNDATNVYNYADIRQAVVGGVSAMPAISVSGTSAKLTNYGKIIGGTDDYVVSLGIVHDASVTGANQSANAGYFENHGIIVQYNAGLNAHIIQKAGINPSDTVLVLGSETILYGATNTNLSINCGVAQDIKIYGYPVSNCDVNPLVGNLITGTNLIWDTGVEVNY